MITRTRIKKALESALDEKDPMNKKRQRKSITWPMAKFRHTIAFIADMPQVTDVHFEFTEEDIKNELTTAVFKTNDRTIRLIYDYKEDMVECFAIGKDLDAVKKFIHVTETLDFVREYFPVKKRVVVIKKKDSV